MWQFKGCNMLGKTCFSFCFCRKSYSHVLSNCFFVADVKWWWSIHSYISTQVLLLSPHKSTHLHFWSICDIFVFLEMPSISENSLLINDCMISLWIYHYIWCDHLCSITAILFLTLVWPGTILIKEQNSLLKITSLGWRQTI